ncbi:MAG TPA: pyridoxamine 5'-phosphate oxidase family protein [Syntrophorhabdaceae bacterium]|nr:pyridoxamine 5'-phosphate oxidase family protein [Syntrophorhabdaceae bacterium]
MRKANREIKDTNELDEILRKADVCRIAFAVDNIPYIVPMNFGYIWSDKLMLYFHCAREGKKLDLMNKNNTICFEMDVDHQLVRSEEACNWGMKYRSIIGLGILESVSEEDERRIGLDSIMDHYGFKGNKHYDKKSFDLAEVLKVTVTEFTGKKKA